MPYSESIDRLKGLFRELFRLDTADLDFGLYRMFRLKQAEIDAFLGKQLPAEAEHAFLAATGEEREKQRKQVQQLAKHVRESVADDAIVESGDPNPKYAEIKAIKEYAEARKQLQAIEVSEVQRSEVFNHLYSFFSRYYDGGDFIPRRFFGARPAYAVPYDGEEVFFHWANKDQYYVKSGEAFRDYSFTLNTLQGDYRVRFELGEATIPKDNTKGDTRFFFPRPGNVRFDSTSLTMSIPFEYRLPTEGEVARYGKNSKGQEVVFDETAPAILKAVADETLHSALAAPSPAGGRGEGAESPSLLRRRLTHFARKRSTDYFLHKDLGTFLRQELEFFIRDQIVHEADLEGDFEVKRRMLRVFRKLANTVITFLAQIEDAQKRLFEKKKFVLETRYLIPIRSVPRDLWKDVLANDAQVREWKELYSLDGPYKEALEELPTVVVDTRHFSSDFVVRLLESIEDLDEWTDGVLIHGENFQALNVVQERYKELVKSICIDPPYNRGGDFPYKDTYRHSSWTAMMANRVELAWRLLESEGALFSNIDENERDRLLTVLQSVFGSSNRIEELVWAQNTTHSQSPLYSTNHEYIEVFVRDRAAAEQAPTMFKERKPGFSELRALVSELNPHYPPVVEVEAAIKTLFARHIEEYKASLQEMGLEYNKEAKNQDPWRGLYNYSHAEYRDSKGRVVEEQDAATKEANLVIWRESDPSAPAQKQSETTRDDRNPNYRFYRPIHPTTRKPCSLPRRGWAWPLSWPDNTRDSFEALDQSERIVWGDYESKIPQYKRFLNEVETNVAKSFFHDYTDGEKEIAALFGGTGVFPTPKPTTLAARFVSQTCGTDGLVLDYFAGSGTTGHAVINLNREDGGRRKFILVEMADYFDTVLVPRIKKVMYTPQWKDGKPKRPATKEEAERTPRIVKVISLEGYEDALHNTFSPSSIDRISGRENAYRKVVGDEEYRLRYLLKLPVDHSDSMLDLAKLEHPFDYTIDVLTDTGPKPTKIDLMETFTWLYGLRVHRFFQWVNEKDSAERDKLGRVYQGILGADREGKKRVLVVWRDMTDIDPAMDREFLERKAGEIGPVEERWVNGDSAAKDFASLDALFKRLM